MRGEHDPGVAVHFEYGGDLSAKHRRRQWSVGQTEGDGVYFEGNDTDLAARTISGREVFGRVDVGEEGDVGVESDADTVDIQNWEVCGRGMGAVPVGCIFRRGPLGS